MIGFDEFHHGFLERDPSWRAVIKLIFADRWGWGLTQAAFAGLVALLAASIRFGKPVEVSPRSRRHQSEFAVAAGRLLGSSQGAVPQVYPTLRKHYRRSILDALGLDRDSGDSTLFTALEKHLGSGRSQDAIACLDPAAGEPSGKAELLARTRKTHELLKEIRHGHTAPD